MKKIVIALTAMAAMTGSALAADMAPRTYTKAPAPVAAVANWTGCYVAGGGGYGMWNQENTGIFIPFVGPPVQGSETFTNGGRGYFGTVGGGCDYQFALGSWNMVIGAFGDYDFADIKGRRSDPMGFGPNPGVGNEKLSSQWAFGGRIGALITPSLLAYFVGGYTEARFDRTNYTNVLAPIGVPNGLYTDAATHKGYFIGAGDEYALSFMPGLFWKTEYRASVFDRQEQLKRVVATGLSFGQSYDTKTWEHSVRSELVYRFNWGGSVVAKY